VGSTSVMASEKREVQRLGSAVFAEANPIHSVNHSISDEWTARGHVYTNTSEHIHISEGRLTIQSRVSNKTIRKVEQSDTIVFSGEYNTTPEQLSKDKKSSTLLTDTGDGKQPERGIEVVPSYRPDPVIVTRGSGESLNIKSPKRGKTVSIEPKESNTVPGGSGSTMVKYIKYSDDLVSTDMDIPDHMISLDWEEMEHQAEVSTTIECVNYGKVDIYQM